MVQVKIAEHQGNKSRVANQHEKGWFGSVNLFGESEIDFRRFTESGGCFDIWVIPDRRYKCGYRVEKEDLTN